MQAEMSDGSKLFKKHCINCSSLLLLKYTRRWSR